MAKKAAVKASAGTDVPAGRRQSAMEKLPRAKIKRHIQVLFGHADPESLPVKFPLAGMLPEPVDLAQVQEIYEEVRRELLEARPLLFEMRGTIEGSAQDQCDRFA